MCNLDEFKIFIELGAVHFILEQHVDFSLELLGRIKDATNISGSFHSSPQCSQGEKLSDALHVHRWNWGIHGSELPLMSKVLVAFVVI